jgi:hypothetical protein
MSLHGYLPYTPLQSHFCSQIVGCPGSLYSVKFFSGTLCVPCSASALARSPASDPLYLHYVPKTASGSDLCLSWALQAYRWYSVCLCILFYIWPMVGSLSVASPVGPQAVITIIWSMTSAVPVFTDIKYIELGSKWYHDYRYRKYDVQSHPRGSYWVGHIHWW